MRNLFAVTRARGPGWDPGKSMHAQTLWSEHAAFMNQLAASGFVVMGGLLENTDEVLLAIEAQTEESLRETLRRDPWSEAGILNVTSVQRWTVLLEHKESERPGNKAK